MSLSETKTLLVNANALQTVGRSLFRRLFHGHLGAAVTWRDLYADNRVEARPALYDVLKLEKLLDLKRVVARPIFVPIG